MNFGIEMMELDVSCPTHGLQTVQRIKAIDGTPFPTKHTPECPACAAEQSAFLAQQRLASEKAERVDRLIEMAHIPLRYRGISFEDYVTTLPGQQRAGGACQRYVASIANKGTPGWLVLTGRPGTGKTMLLSCMAKALAERFVRSEYATQAAMGREFRATYQRDATRTEAALFDHLANVPVLLLDELGAGSTEHTDRLLFEVLDERYANKLPAVIATNHPRAALESVIGERLFDRLKEEATFLAFDWESSRKPAGLRSVAA